MTVLNPYERQEAARAARLRQLEPKKTQTRKDMVGDQRAATSPKSPPQNRAASAKQPAGTPSPQLLPRAASAKQPPAGTPSPLLLPHEQPSTDNSLLPAADDRSPPSLLLNDLQAHEPGSGLPVHSSPAPSAGGDSTPPSSAETVVPASASTLSLVTSPPGATQVERLQQELASTRAALLLAQAETATAVRVAEALKACTPAGSSASCLQCIAASNLKAAKAQKRRAYEKKRYREKGGREAQKRMRAVKKEKLEPKEEELLSQLTQETLSQEY